MALDAHVGQSIFENVLRNNPAGKPHILVMHVLDFLPPVDSILTVVDGDITEVEFCHNNTPGCLTSLAIAWNIHQFNVKQWGIC